VSCSIGLLNVAKSSAKIVERNKSLGRPSAVLTAFFNYVNCMTRDILFTNVLQCMDVTAYKMKEEVDEAASRLLFLLDYAVMPSI
jgi:hypothetical protein